MDLIFNPIVKIKDISLKNSKEQIKNKIIELDVFRELHEQINDFYNFRYYTFKIISLISILGSTVSFLSLVPFYIPNILASIGLSSTLILLLFQFEKKAIPHKLAVKKLKSIKVELELIYNMFKDKNQIDDEMIMNFLLYIFKATQIICELPGVPRQFRKKEKNLMKSNDIKKSTNSFI